MDNTCRYRSIKPPLERDPSENSGARERGKLRRSISRNTGSAVESQENGGRWISGDWNCPLLKFIPLLFLGVALLWYGLLKMKFIEEHRREARAGGGIH